MANTPEKPQRQTTPSAAPAPAKKPRLDSIDAFRGFTIFAMIFVIQVSGYRNLPLTFPHFDSAPVSTFKHAGEDGEEAEWSFWEGKSKSTTYQPAVVRERKATGLYDVELKIEEEKPANAKAALDTAKDAAKELAAGEKKAPEIFRDVRIVHAKPLYKNDPVIAIYDQGDNAAPRFRGVGNGCTFTDLVAPFFVFIVGMCIPLSRQRRGGDWWMHVGTRTIGLILLGVLYISLILKLSYWWGILQAIGVSYFMGAFFMRFKPSGRWIAVAVIAAIHAFLSWKVSWWLDIGDKSKGFLTIERLYRTYDAAAKPMDALRPLTVHCTPWASISYGLLTMIGTILGEALVSRERSIILKQCLTIGISLSVIGYLLHRFQAPMNKDHVSISYSIFTSGIGALTFLAFYWVIDVWGFKAWAWPLNVYGANALLAYFMQPVVRVFIKALGFYDFFTNRAAWDGMLWGLIWTMLLWAVVLVCNKRNIYWKI